MAQELYVLRHRYKDAYAAYADSVRALCYAAERGLWPDSQVLAAEDKAFDDLSHLRQALLRGLFARRIQTERQGKDPAA